ncbi:MAG: nucleoside-diphosphate sugar epimerase/dehydratase [Ferrimonas sp.]
MFDAVALLSAFYLPITFYYNTSGVEVDKSHGFILVLTILTSLLVFIRLGLYRSIVRFIGHKALRAVFTGTSISTLLLIGIHAVLQVSLPLPIAIIYWALASLSCGMPRMLVRSLVGVGRSTRKEPVLIYGAGSSGRQLVTTLTHGHEYRAVAFIDDNKELQGKQVLDLMVHPASALTELVHTTGVKKLLLAMPSSSRSERRRVIERLSGLSVEVLTIPGSADLISGTHKIDQLHEVSIEDLLGRDAVAPQPQLMAANIQNKVVMVTGAGGSIGSEMCRQVLLLNARQLILFELSEVALYAIHRELEQRRLELGLEIEIIPLLGNVQSRARLVSVMTTFAVNTIYHAAAYKHVPLVEYNVTEGVTNNILGTWHTAEAAIEAKVETFVLISTDKAVRPTNVMGTSKRLAELVLQGLAKRQQDTRFCMVRFGNVLGSSGSVVPLFREQIRLGGPITLTHQAITRYFMTIPEASQLVIQAGAMGKGGDVFVLDMGEPVRIYDLATRMIALSGLELRDSQNPSGDIEIQITGLRPGEKLYEELLIGDNNVEGTSHPRIMTATEVSMAWDAVAQLLIELQNICKQDDQNALRSLLMNAPAAFTPHDDIADLLWNQHQRTVSPEIAQQQSLSA